MNSLRVLCLLLIAPTVIWAQSSPDDSPTNNTELAGEVKALREALLQTQKQMAAQQQQIETLKAQSNAGLLPTSNRLSPTEGEASAPNSASASIQPATVNTAAYVQPQPTPQDQEKAPSLAQGFKIGDAVLTPGGFVDLENIFRTTNTQSNIATSFASIPYSNTPQGNISEFRTTAQYSRLNLMVKDKYRGNDITGYIEGDFSGNDAPGVYQSVNPHTNRLRLYFGDFKRGKWEFLGGQSWSWMTPNRTGIGPIPADLALTYNEDQNLGVGLPYTRAAEFRVAYHANEHWAMGVGIENPNQFIGNYVALPVAFGSMVGPQFDNGSQIGAANAFPDILSKVTYDHDISSRHFHAEAEGFVTGAHASVKPVGEDSFKRHSTVGGGGQIAANYELLPKLALLGNVFWSDGGAHYLVATGPQLVVRPNEAGTDISLSMVHAGAGSAGIEWRASEKEALAVYYGADYFARNFFPDTTNTAEPGTIIGYGGPGSANTNNRAIQQATFDWLQTFWKDTRYGALQSYIQYSYLTRAPWFVAPDTPKNAHLSMVYFGVRYVLPSTSGTLLRVPYPN
ncbi:MAG: hypothetical protein WAK24_17170 [Candidatus Acidiferrales bacterium]